MKILFTVEFYEPHKGGAEEVVKQLAERLAKKGHQVSVVTSSLKQRTFKELNGVKIEEFKISGNLARGIIASAKELKRYENFLLGDFEIMLNYAAQIWTTDLALEVLDKIKAKKILVPCGYSGLNNKKYEKYFEKLPGHLIQYDKLVYMSPRYRDKIFGDTYGLNDKAVIIPNGASEEEFLSIDTYNIKEKLKIRTNYLLLTVANHYRAKGHRFVIQAFRKTKRKDATLLIVGEKSVSSGIKKIGHFLLDYVYCYFASALSKHIILAEGRYRPLVLSAYKSANLFLFGSEVETAPLVMYESFAARVPVITTNVGNVSDHKDVLKIVATPAEMAKEINFLLDHKDARDALAARAYAIWKNIHTWEKIAERYEELFSSLVSRRE